MKLNKYLALIIFLSLVKLAIHLLANGNYGFHRDELLHLSVGRHLDWGYMEFPPLIALIGKTAHFIFGYSLEGVRLFATLAGVGILVITCLTAKELGGKIRAVAISGTAVLAFLPFYRNHTLFQPVAFDQFFWTLGFYFLVRYFNTKNGKFLVYLGITLGFGLMNKYTMLVWALGIFAGLFYGNWKIFREKRLYLCAAVALLMVLPNILWQFHHHFPVLLHLQKLKESQLDENGPFDFFLEQLSHPFTFILSVIGLLACFLDPGNRKLRGIGISITVIFAAMWVLQSKSYYFFAAYPVLFALGAVKIEKWSQKKPAWNYLAMAILLLPAIYFIPKAAPVLPLESYIRYENLKPDDNGRYHLTDDYADMFGWTEQVRLIDSIYRKLPPQDRKDCIILAGNYGEAGAITILGKAFGLPDPVCASGSFWLWGPGKTDPKVAITIGYGQQTISSLFEESTLVKTIKHPFAIGEENNIPVYICRKPKIDIKALWPKLERRVFD